MSTARHCKATPRKAEIRLGFSDSRSGRPRFRSLSTANVSQVIKSKAPRFVYVGTSTGGDSPRWIYDAFGEAGYRIVSKRSLDGRRFDVYKRI